MSEKYFDSVTIIGHTFRSTVEKVYAMINMKSADADHHPVKGCISTAYGDVIARWCQSVFQLVKKRHNNDIKEVNRKWNIPYLES